MGNTSTIGRKTRTPASRVNPRTYGIPGSQTPGEGSTRRKRSKKQKRKYDVGEDSEGVSNVLGGTWLEPITKTGLLVVVRMFLTYICRCSCGRAELGWRGGR